MNLRHTRLILKREYIERLKRPGFIIGTIMGLIGFAALAFLPTLLNFLSQQDVTKVAIVDPHNIIYPYLPRDVGALPTPSASTDLSQPSIPLSSGIKFIKADTTDPDILSQRVTKGDITAYVEVQGDSASNVSFVYHGKDRPSISTSARLLTLLSAAATQAKLQQSGISPQQAQTLFSAPSFKVQPIVQGTLKDEKTYIQSAALVYALLLLLYATMLMYGIQVAMGVVEEKSSRVMEVLITAVRPIELMIGKVLGIGLLGLTQYAVWVATGFVVLVLSGTFGKISSGTGIDIASVPAETLIFFLVFFVLGYVLFAAIYAALGSLVSRSEDVNSVTTPLTILMVGAYLVSIYSLGNPEAEFVKWLSFVPFFTPMLMFIRVALSNPAWWEVALSIVLLAGTSFLFTWLAAKIYRVGVLLYGKRPSFREVGRLIRAA
jgi:ABC-2 type transport system permease protein